MDLSHSPTDGQSSCIETYVCQSKKCPYEIRVVRIPGGLVLLEKQNAVNGILVLVAHNQRAHDYVPSFSTRYNASTLSLIRRKSLS